VPDLAELNKQIRQLTASTDRVARRLRRGHRLMATAIAVLVVVGSGVILWNRHSIDQNNRNFCSYLSVQAGTDRGVVDPPNTAGRRQAEEAERLAKTFGCANA
jgi:hypothetical protein